MKENLPPINDMYTILNGKPDCWGIDGYQVSKRYEDPIKLKQQRTGSILKKASNKQAKKGHYLDLLMKQSVGPGPIYDVSQSMVSSKKTNAIPPTTKKTYIDEILRNGEKYKFPSPDSYKILGNFQKEGQKAKKYGQVKRKYNQKTNFLNTNQYYSSVVPGPGQYNPHEIKTPLRENHFSPKQLRQADQQKLKKQSSTKVLGPSYDPIYPKTFSQRALLPKYFAENKSRSHVNNQDQGKKTKKIDVKNPGPGQYNVVNQWKGKGDTSKSNLLNSLSFGYQPSVYH